MEKNLTINIKSAIFDAFIEQFDIKVPAEKIAIEATKKEFEGDFTFIVFPFIKLLKLSPQELSNKIGDFLAAQNSFILSYNVVKGFLNLTLTDTAWLEALAYKQQSFNKVPISPSPKKMMVEFSSPNTNKPLHFGHLRNNFLGDSVSKILTAVGHQVKKVNLVNDRGIHICKSMYAYKILGDNETPESSGTKSDHFVGKYYVLFNDLYKKEVEQLIKEGHKKEDAEKQAPSLLASKEMLKKWEEGDEATLALWHQMNQWAYNGFDTTYEKIDIKFDQLYKESETYLLGKNFVEEGLKKGLFYKKEDGSVWVDLADEGLDTKLLLRSDGTSVYITQDLGTTEIKYQDFPFDQLIFVVGSEQDYHFKVLFAIIKKLEKSYANGLKHLSYGMVDLPSGKMKSREGTVVDADDLIDDMIAMAKLRTEALGKVDSLSKSDAKKLYHMIGIGALKYYILKIDPKKKILFNPEESIEFQGNTGSFIQYTYARIHAILNKAKQSNITLEIDKSHTLHPLEKDIVCHLVHRTDMLQEAANLLSPAVVAQYVYDLAKKYNKLYQELSILSEPNEKNRQFRIALSDFSAITIKECMKLLSIEVPSRM